MYVAQVNQAQIRWDAECAERTGQEPLTIVVDHIFSRASHFHSLDLTEKMVEENLIDFEFVNNPATHIGKNYHTFLLKSENIVLYLHGNGLCVIQLAHDHPVLGSATAPTLTLTFNTPDQTNLAAVQYRKGRGPCITPNMLLCRMSYGDDGTCVDVPACIEGVLVDVNTSLAQFRGVALRQALLEEYVAIVELTSSQIGRLKSLYG